MDPSVSGRTSLLFICTGNIARSQMAEGWARHIAGDRFEIFSAGSKPNPRGVYPPAIRVMAERGIDISGQRSKGLDAVPSDIDIVVTVCDSAAKECPALRGRIATHHWSIPDPGDLVGATEEDLLAFCRVIRDDLEKRVRQRLSAS